MDDLILKHGGRRLKAAANMNSLQKEIVGRTYGFDYEKHFRSMLIRLVGLVSCEHIDKKVDSVKDAKLRAQLSSLKNVRDRLAHTYVKGSPATYVIDAPSVTKARFHDLYEGLIEYERVLRTM